MKTAEIGFRPFCLDFDHAPERSEPKTIGPMVESEGDAAAVVVVITTGAAFLALEDEAVSE